jgi:hypothetical protein
MTAGVAPTVASAAGFGGRPPPRRMRLISFKRLPRGALRGFANIKLPNVLRISECPVFVSGDKAWAALPAKPAFDRSGKRIQVNGKGQFSTIIEWPSREVRDRFSTALVELVRNAHPGALDDGGGAS